MNNIIRQLEPQGVWGFFDDICQIPRPSKKELLPYFTSHKALFIENVEVAVAAPSASVQV